MDWGTEQYVRLYTRDTEEWIEWTEQTQLVWMLMMRKADRSGLLAFRTEGGLAKLLGCSLATVQAALGQLLDPEHPKPPCSRVQAGIHLRNYVPAQTTPRSGPQRTSAWRERKKLSLIP